MRGRIRTAAVLSIVSLVTTAPAAFGKPDSNNAKSCGTQPNDEAEVAAARALAEEECPCATADRHVEYVRCVEKVARAAVRDFRLRNQCRLSVVFCARKSTCGKEGYVTCCRTDKF